MIPIAILESILKCYPFIFMMSNKGDGTIIWKESFNLFALQICMFIRSIFILNNVAFIFFLQGMAINESVFHSLLYGHVYNKVRKIWFKNFPIPTPIPLPIILKHKTVPIIWYRPTGPRYLDSSLDRLCPGSVVTVS